jgi:hypothetical protein
MNKKELLEFLRFTGTAVFLSAAVVGIAILVSYGLAFLIWQFGK